LLLCGKLNVKTKTETWNLIAGQVRAAADRMPVCQTDLVRSASPIKEQKTESNDRKTK
jgi:hypothetical protein